MDFSEMVKKQREKNHGIVKSAPDRKTDIREWYMENYPDDELGEEITSMTFESLWIYPEYAEQEGMKMDIYDIIGVGDSIVRERLFEALSTVYNKNYDVVYDHFFNRKRMCWT